MRCSGDEAKESRLRWLGLVQRKDSDYISKRMPRLELAGRRPRRRPKRRLVDVVNDNIKLVDGREEDAEDRVR